MAVVRASVRHCRLWLHVVVACPENTDEFPAKPVFALVYRWWALREALGNPETKVSNKMTVESGGNF